MRFGMVALLAFSFVGAANASQDVGNVDAYEKTYVKCMSDGFPDSCIEHIFSGNFDPAFLYGEQIAIQMQIFLSAQKKDLSIYQVHNMGSRLISDVFDVRSYLIEFSDGHLVGVRVGFKRILGKWYILDMQAGATYSFIRQLVDMPRLSPKQ